MWVIVTISTTSGTASHLLVLEERRIEVAGVVVKAA